MADKTMNHRLRAFGHKYQGELRLLLLLAVLMGTMILLSPGRFLSSANMKNIAFQIPEFCLFALAMMVVIVTGGINLSITATAAIAQIVIAMVVTRLTAAGTAPAAAIAMGLAAALAASVVCGLLNGLLVAYLHVNPMLATLGTMMFYEGIALRVTNGSSITGFPEMYQVFGAGEVLGIPVPIVLLVVAVAAVYLLLERTAWGESVFFCGSNSVATAYSGVNVKRTLLKAYILSAILSMLAALIMTSRYNSAKVDYGSSYLMMALTAVLLGGTDVNGGYGKVAGTVVGVAIIQVVGNGLNIFGTNRYFVNVVTGAILLLVLAVKHLSEVHRNKTLPRKGERTDREGA